MIIDYNPSLPPEESAKQLYKQLEVVWNPDVKNCLLTILVRDVISRIPGDRKHSLEISNFEED
ncbi:MAG: hypothetical protein AABW47_01720 [Nanoarchaeota archaeon]